MKRVVLTGGPCGGKTTFLELVTQELGSAVQVVPEAATMLFKGGFPRPLSQTDTPGRLHLQSAIFHLQKELEPLCEQRAKSSKKKLLLCDRGTLDGLGYWPKSKAHFFRHLHTTPELELSRYTLVIHLESAPRRHYLSVESTRTESYQEALKIDKKILNAWRGHPQRVWIRSRQSFLEKMEIALSCLKDHLVPRPLSFSLSARRDP